MLLKMKLNSIIKKLKNRKIIITAGGTQEPIDPIRYIGNYSSGKMGIALANVFSKYSDKVVLIHGHITVPVPGHIRACCVQTVNEMYKAVNKHITKSAVLIMAAAVSDFKVKKVFKRKIKKKVSELKLLPTIDILQCLSGKKQKSNFFVGFAVETDNIIENAREKLKKKKLDFIIANPVNRQNNPFGSDYNKVYFITKDESREFPKMKKSHIAREVLKYVCESLLR